MKSLAGVCERILEFPPGHYYLGHEPEKGFQKYYEPKWAEPGFYPSEPYDPARLRTALEAAVHRQLMSDVPYGVLISGGIDSSIVAAVAAKFSARRVDENDLVSRVVAAIAFLRDRPGRRARSDAGENRGGAHRLGPS